MSTRSAGGPPGTATQPCPCSPRRSSPLPAPASQQTHRLAGGLIPHTCNEIRRLLAITVLCLDRGIRFVLRWSCWRRRHQARAELSHYQRRGELHDHPSHRMITDRDTKDQLEVLL
jgi:hypothetical protein